jgi:hypothetical protein
MNEIKQVWNSMTEEEKQPYSQMAAKERDIYIEKMNEW